MSKSAKKRPTASAPAAVPTTKSSRHGAGDPEPKRADRGSKQSRVIALLQSPTGATIEAMMKATGWQQDGNRVYQIASGNHLSPAPTPASLRAMPRVKIGPVLPDREKLDADYQSGSERGQSSVNMPGYEKSPIDKVFLDVRRSVSHFEMDQCSCFRQRARCDPHCFRHPFA